MFKKVIFGLSIIALALACSSSDETTSSSNMDGFDRSTILIFWADDVIVPAYQELNTDLADLKSKKDVFVATPNQTNLDNLRTSYLTAYKSWQSIEMFNIGKSESLNYVFQMNVYPVNTTDVENNISTESYDLTHPNNNDAVGFPAVDYLLYGVASDDTAILTKYTETKYKNYLSDIINQMKVLTQTVLDDWTSVYRNTFVASTDNTTTSAVNKLTNDFIYYFEKGLRANKVGIPAGVFSTSPLADKVEAYYANDFSKELAEEAINAVENFYNGIAYNSSNTGVSFKTYMSYLGRDDINSAVTSQFALVYAKLDEVDTSFSNQISTNNTKMTELYDELQKLVVLFKVDMVQAMNVSIDYVDADGD